MEVEENQHSGPTRYLLSLPAQTTELAAPNGVCSNQGRGRRQGRRTDDESDSERLHANFPCGAGLTERPLLCQVYGEDEEMEEEEVTPNRRCILLQ